LGKESMDPVYMVYIIIGTLLGGELFTKIILRPLTKYKWGVEIYYFFTSLLRIIYVTIAIAILLSYFNIDASKVLLGTTGIVSFIVGFGFKDLLSNVAAGLWILIVDPFDVGDTVEVAGVRGTIEKITSLAIIIKTEDGVVYVPNSTVWGSTIKKVEVRT
jgi:small conductance mechanosensitive channel